MSTPFKSVTLGYTDAFNFDQTQLRINTECSFGTSVNMRAILCTPNTLKISLKRTT